MNMTDQGIRQALLSGKPRLGCWLFGVNPLFCELAGRLGLDCLLIDMEHGETRLSDIPALVRACATGSASRAANNRTAVVVRPPSHDSATLSKLADFGVDGVVVPKVETAEQASAIAAACRYPPRGTRGLAPGSIRASGYGIESGYRAQADDHFLVAVQIETVTAMDNLDAIAAETEVDLLFVGPNDLSGDLGHATQNDESAAITDQLLDRIIATGKPAGTIPYQGRTRESLTERGVAFVIAGSDVAAQRLYLEKLVAGDRTGSDY